MAVVQINQVPFSHSLSTCELKDAHARINDSRAFTKARVKDLSEAVKAGDKLGKAAVIALLMDDPRIKLFSAVRANAALPGHRRAPLEKVLKVASTLDLAKPIKELVSCWAKPKKSGGHRVIHDHGLMHRTGQDLVKRVMDQINKPRQFQFTHQGLHAAMAQVKALIKSGFTHVAHLDIQDFYGSFKLEKLLNELPLPVGAVTNVVVGRHQEVVWNLDVSKGGSGLSPLPHTHNHLDMQARLGMPQGSACSSIIGAHFVSRLQWKPAAHLGLVNFVDDFLLLAKSAETLAKAVDALVAAVGQLPGGTFNLKLKEKRLATQGFTFLGHVVQMSGGDLLVWPSSAAQESLLDEVTSLDQKLGAIVYPPGAPSGKFNKTAAVAKLARFAAVTRGWRAAFKECSAINPYLDLVCSGYAAWKEVIGVTDAQIAKATSPDMEYQPDPYALGK